MASLVKFTRGVALVARRGRAWLSGILAYGRPAMGVAGLL